MAIVIHAESYQCDHCRDTSFQKCIPCRCEIQEAPGSIRVYVRA